MTTCTRIESAAPPSLPEPADYFHRGDWPARWISVPKTIDPSFVAAYRLKFAITKEETIRIHVSADQRYELYLDGVRVGRGSERGDTFAWHFETYEMSLTDGEHLLVARVWTWAPVIAPTAQLTLKHGFLLAAEAPWTETLSTGLAPWEGKKLKGYSYINDGLYAGGAIVLDGREFDWGFEADRTGAWGEVEKGEFARSRFNTYGEIKNNPMLRPAPLPAMIDRSVPQGKVRHLDGVGREKTRATPISPTAHLADEATEWQQMVQGRNKATIPARSQRRAILDLDDYYCGYAGVTLSGGRDATVRIHWAEGTYEGPHDQKGNRDVIEGKIFRGRGDAFVAGGGPAQEYRGLWWGAGRYLEVQVETGDVPLSIEGFGVSETRYPLEMQGSVTLDDRAFTRLAPILWRTLQMCSHETYMDCPYYEQLMYTGDTRLQVLVTYLLNGDDRLPRKALECFGASLLPVGLTQSRYPSFNTQVIPQFSLYWIAMLHDFALWRGDRDFVRKQMPTARTILETFIASVNADDLLILPNGWDWCDWVGQWPNGQPPQGKNGVSAVNHWQFVMVLGQAAELEEWLEEPLLAQRLRAIQVRLAASGLKAFWNEQKGLLADTDEHASFSEHAQCYAILSGCLEPGHLARLTETLAVDSGLTRGTYYFQHYLFEAWRVLGKADRLLARLQEWEVMVDNGARTGFEKPDPTRSDCHAWTAHPLYHAAATLIGIRPVGLGSRDIVIEPQLGSLTSAQTEIILSSGRLSAVIRREGPSALAEIVLPQGVCGTFRTGEKSTPLHPGENRIGWPA